MNLDFWSIIAQISATLLGLVFAGQVFYLTNINDAMEVQKIQDFGFQDISSQAMVICILTNIILFLYPLLVAVCLITTTGRQVLIFWEVFWVLVIIFIIVLELVINKKSKDIFANKNLKDKKNPKFELVVNRVKLGQVFVCIGVVLLVGLLVPYKVFSIQVFEILLQFAVITMIIIGLGLIVFDLIAFEKQNILFKSTGKTLKIIERMNQELNLRRQQLDSLYIDYSNILRSDEYAEWEEERFKEIKDTLSHAFQKNAVEMIDNEKVERKIFLENCRNSIEKIPPGKNPKFIADFIAETNRNGFSIYSLNQIFKFQEELDNITMELNNFTTTLKGRLSYLRENGVIDKSGVKSRMS